MKRKPTQHTHAWLRRHWNYGGRAYLTLLEQAALREKAVRESGDTAVENDVTESTESIEATD